MTIEIELVNTETGEIRKITHVDSNPFARLNLKLNNDNVLTFVGTCDENMLDDLQDSEEISRICLNGEEVFYFE